jgi:acyl-CoA thioester hydrolase
MTSSLPFCQTITVRYRDLDAQGHLYFANYLVYVDEVVGAYSEALGLDVMDRKRAPCMIFTVNIHCDYLNEVTGNNQINVCTGYKRLGNSSAEVVFELYNKDDGILLAKGGLTQVFIDAKTRKSIPIPSFYRKAIINRQPDLKQNQ